MGYYKENLLEITELYEDGVSVEEIAKKFEMTTTEVINALGFLYYEEEKCDGQPSEMQEWHDFDPDC